MVAILMETLNEYLGGLYKHQINASKDAGTTIRVP